MVLAHRNESVRAAARDLDAFGTLDGFVDSRLSVDEWGQRRDERDQGKDSTNAISMHGISE